MPSTKPWPPPNAATAATTNPQPRETTVKIDVHLTLDIDPERWADEYDIDPADVPQDVTRHVTNIADAHLNSLGLLTGGPR